MKEQTPIRVLGPYAFRDQWRCAIRNGQRKTYLSPENTPERALAVAERFVSELTASQPVTVSAAIDRYQQYLKDKGNKPASYEITPLRLRRFFGSMLGAPLFSLTERRCQALYDGLREQTSERTGKPLSVDTHRAYLADARSFGRWAVKVKLMRTSPVAEIEGMGRRRRGKPQLRHDEAHVWLNRGEELAQQGETGAVAAMMTLLMGLRCSEIVGRVVRDLDQGGTVLWIPDSKTEAGKRKVKVPTEAVAAAPAPTFRVEYEKFTLPNGLDVIFHVDRSDPVVAVNLTAHVGSAREKPGRTGFAHLFEHLLFLESEHLGKGGLDKLTARVGGSGANGSTSRDRTNYLQTRGYHVLRFWNHEVIEAPELVVDAILIHLQCTPPQPSPAQQGRE